MFVDSTSGKPVFIPDTADYFMSWSKRTGRTLFPIYPVAPVRSIFIPQFIPSLFKSRTKKGLFSEIYNYFSQIREY